MHPNNTHPFPKRDNVAKCAVVAVAYKAFDVQCPHCFSELAQPATGSLLWFDNEDHGQKSQVCTACNKAYKLPKALRGVKRE